MASGSETDDPARITDVRQAVESLARATRDGFIGVRSDIVSLENQKFFSQG